MAYYITGDCHALFDKLIWLARFNKKLKKEDVIILLGDVGLNYFGVDKDQENKKILADFPNYFLCIHGNHEERPYHIQTYRTQIWHEIIRTYKEQGRKSEIQSALKQIRWQVHESTASIPEDLCYLEGKYLEDYLHDVKICQVFARRSREKIAEIILKRTGMNGCDAFHTIHNYIDTDEMILRKGAIAAHKGERVLIPINMKDGSILAIGKGNPEWNYSAPHGAGRIMSRSKAKETLNMEEYKKSMSGIYTTSVNEATLDEAPMAYKSIEDIIDVIRESVDVIEVMKPIYNFKAS